MKSLDVYGIGNPLIDLLAHVPDQFLEQAGLEKDRMYLVGQEEKETLLENLTSQNIQILYAPGGSCANTMIGIAQLGGKTAFSGKVGNDKYGTIYFL